MTVKELKDSLSKFPDDSLVCQAIWMEVHQEADINEIDIELYESHYEVHKNNEIKKVVILNQWVTE